MKDIMYILLVGRRNNLPLDKREFLGYTKILENCWQRRIMIDIKAFVTVYSLDGEDCSSGIDTPRIEVKSDAGGRVTLVINNHEYSVYAEDLMTAVSRTRSC